MEVYANDAEEKRDYRRQDFAQWQSAVAWIRQGERMALEQIELARQLSEERDPQLTERELKQELGCPSAYRSRKQSAY